MQRENAPPTPMGLHEDTDLYRFFAYLLGHPSHDRFSWFSQANLHGMLAALWAGLGLGGDAPDLSLFQNYEQYEAGYIALFDVGIPAPPVPLLESHYHEAVPAQHTVLENADYFEVLGLRPATSVAAPDHLITQLEFLASARYLQENCKIDSEMQNLRLLERDFLERHLLSWIPIAQARLMELNPPVFPILFSLLLQFLRSRYQEFV